MCPGTDDVCTVGGFSSSPYLFTQVTKHFEKTSATDAASTSDLPILPISVMQPPNAWTAVARGAVLKGLEEGTVSSRCSRFNYGTPYSPKYVEGVHEFKHTFFDKFEGCRRTLSAMRWYVRPGEAVNESEAIRLEYNRTVAGEAIPSGDKLRVHDDLWADDSDEQAIMWDAKTMWRGCRLETDLSEVPKDLWVKKKTPYGEPFWQIHFFLEMRIESAGMEFSMKFGDNTYGSVKATFNHSDADLRG